MVKTYFNLSPRGVKIGQPGAPTGSISPLGGLSLRRSRYSPAARAAATAAASAEARAAEKWKMEKAVLDRALAKREANRDLGELAIEYAKNSDAVAEMPMPPKEYLAGMEVFKRNTEQPELNLSNIPTPPSDSEFHSIYQELNPIDKGFLNSSAARAHADSNPEAIVSLGEQISRQFTASPPTERGRGTGLVRQNVSGKSETIEPSEDTKRLKDAGSALDQKIAVISDILIGRGMTDPGKIKIIAATAAAVAPVHMNTDSAQLEVVDVLAKLAEAQGVPLSMLSGLANVDSGSLDDPSGALPPQDVSFLDDAGSGVSNQDIMDLAPPTFNTENKVDVRVARGISGALSKLMNSFAGAFGAPQFSPREAKGQAAIDQVLASIVGAFMTTMDDTRAITPIIDLIKNIYPKSGVAALTKGPKDIVDGFVSVRDYLIQERIRAEGVLEDRTSGAKIIHHNDNLKRKLDPLIAELDRIIKQGYRQMGGSSSDLSQYVGNN